IHLPQERVLWIDAPALRAVVALLLIDRREQDQPVQVFDRPAVFHESAGQVIEQFRMRRRLATQAEVARRPYYAGAEMMHPDPVYHHPRGQGIAAIADGLGKLQPAAALLERLA